MESSLYKYNLIVYKYYFNNKYFSTHLSKKIINIYKNKSI